MNTALERIAQAIVDLDNDQTELLAEILVDISEDRADRFATMIAHLQMDRYYTTVEDPAYFPDRG